MYRVVAAKLSAAVEWKTATMTMVSQSQNNRQENVLSDSDCHHCPKRHTGQRVGLQQATEEAQCPEERDVAVCDVQASGPTIGNLPTLTEEFHQRLVRPRQEGTFGNQEPGQGPLKSILTNSHQCFMVARAPCIGKSSSSLVPRMQSPPWRVCSREILGL